MDFETLINSPKEVIKEYLEKPESLKEIGCSISQVGELIKVAGESITYVENFEKFKDILDIFIDEKNFSDDDAKELGRIMVEWIKDTGKVEEYLNNEEMIKNGYGLYIILAADKAEEYLDEPEKYKNIELSEFDVVELIKSTGKIEKYLKDIEKLKRFEISSYEISELIIESGKAEEYLKKPELLIELGLTIDSTMDLILATGEVDKYLTPEKLYELGMHGIPNVRLIKASKNPENYLLSGQNLSDNELSFKLSVANAIKATGRIEEYLTPEKIVEYELNVDSPEVKELIRLTKNPKKYLFDGQDINNPNLQLSMANIIKGTGRIEEYLTLEKLDKFGLNQDYVAMAELIKATGNIEEYLEPQKLAEYGLQYNTDAILELIKVTGKLEEYLTPERLNEFGLQYDTDAIRKLIMATNNPERYLFKWQDINDSNLQLNMSNIIKGATRIEEYLTPEKLAEFGLQSNDYVITELIKTTKNPERYLFEGQDINDPNLQLEMANVVKGILAQSLTKEDIETVLKFNNETINALSNVDESKQKDAIKILDRLSRSNSAELRRIKEQMALQILEKEPETYEKTLNSIENIYLTSNIPDVGKLYLVFKELHPNLLGEDTKMQDASVGNIPSLKEATTSEKKNMIFTSLLMSAIESNSRNLRDYIETIEQGNEIFKKIRNGEVKAQNLAKNERETITKYNEILNFVYNQSNKEEKRENVGDIEKDINELAKLFRMDIVKAEMPDRLVRMFAYRAEIRSLAQAKEIMKKSREKADERNTEFSKRENINIEEGDFVKGIVNTEYFPSMLQRGILAKDFLGGNAMSDATPLDTDVEKVTKVGKTLDETLKSLEVADGYILSVIDGKKLGKIMLVFSKDNFVETRNQNNEVSKENIELLKQDKDKKEVCHNSGTAYGISMGIGSENIKCIIADKYVDKLGLEIALNGFYIPIVDNDGKVVYTKEMYESFREKMQGLSHYGEKHFELDETAKKPEMSGILELVDRSMQNAKNKQEKILKTLEEAVNKNGYTLSDERRTDLKPGIVEFIDTGSTGRGTNMPGDGDFDYMVRMDKILNDNPTEFKNSLREALRKN